MLKLFRNEQNHALVYSDYLLIYLFVPNHPHVHQIRTNVSPTDSKAYQKYKTLLIRTIYLFTKSTRATKAILTLSLLPTRAPLLSPEPFSRGNPSPPPYPRQLGLTEK